MGIEFTTLAQREAERVGAGVRADRRLYLTKDEDRVVEEGDPAAAFLLAGVGTELPPRMMDKYGLTEEDGVVQIKTIATTADKAAPKTEDKAAPGPVPKTAYPVHKGGGWYELSNGESVQGKDEAEAAQADLDASE